MTSSWLATAIAVTSGIAVAILLVTLLRRQLSRENYVAAAGFLGAALVFGFIARLIKGFSVRSFFVMVAVGYGALLLAT